MDQRNLLIHPDELELFSLSTERSRRRRRGLDPNPPALGEGPLRDLGDPEHATVSLQRALARRRAAAERGGPLDAGGVRRVAATAAVAGVLVTTAEPILDSGSTPAAHAAVRPPLKQGDGGSAVRRLQRALGIGVDGVFGPATERAVKRYQRRHQLTADGLVGSATWAGLASSPGKARTSSRGDAIERLQRAIGVSADGVFGPQTAAAVKRFQRGRGLEADGVVGPATWNAIGGSGPILKQRGSSTSGTPAAVERAISAANRIASLPYRYGGGHASFQDSGYDCSGTVSYVLHAAGKLDRPMDSGSLMSYGSSGPGRYITVYASSSHAFMVINGRRFDTSGRQASGSRWQSSERSSAGYVVRHPTGL